MGDARVFQESAEAAVTGQTTDARVHQENVEAAVTGQTTDARILQNSIEVASLLVPGEPFVRHFDGDDDAISLALGPLGFVFGPGTAVAIVRPQSTGWTQRILKAGSSSSSARWELQINSLGKLSFQFGSSATAATTLAPPWNEWSLIACRKGSGTVPPRWSLYKFNAATWQHEDSAAFADSGLPANSAAIGSGSLFSQYKGLIGILGATNVVLTDNQIESLVTERAAWDSVGLLSLWPLDQTNPVPVQDVIGTADQTSIVGTYLADGAVPWTGTPAPPLTVAPAAIESTAAVGSPTVFDPNRIGPVAGIASTEQFGAVTVFRGLIQPAGITSRQAFGVPKLNSPQYVAPVGIPSLEDQGVVTVNGPVIKKTYTVKLSPGKRGIPSAEAVGTPTLTPSAVKPPSIPSSEAVGTPAIVIPGFVSPVGIASAESVPAPGIARDAVVAPAAIASQEAVGRPGIVRAGTIAPAGIESAEAVGSPTLTVLPQTIEPVAIASSEVVNPATVIQRTAIIVAPPSIGTGLAFGNVTIVLGPAPPIAPTPIITREAFGLPRVNLDSPAGPGGGPAGRIANRLYNVAGAINFAFAINHSEEDALVLRRQYEPGAPTTVSLVRHQGAGEPLRLTLRGTILDPTQKAALDVLYGFCDDDTLTYEDYAQESYEVIITSWDARMERARNPLTRGLHIWRFTLELEVVSVIAGSLPNSGVSV